MWGWMSGKKKAAAPVPPPVDPTSSPVDTSTGEPQPNLFASLGALEQRSLVLLLYHIAGHREIRNSVAQASVMAVSTQCNLGDPHVVDELEKQATEVSA